MKVIKIGICIFFAAGLLQATTVNAALITANAPIGGVGCDLIDAINSANNDANEGGCSSLFGYGDDTILLRHDQVLTASLTSPDLNGLPYIESNIAIIGVNTSDEEGLFTIARSSDPATPAFRIFNVLGNGNLTLKDVEITSGYIEPLPGLGFSGGAGIKVDSGQLSLSGVLIGGNSAKVGGALYVAGGTVQIERSTFIFNEATSRGGAIAMGSGASVSIYDSTISANYSENNGGAIDIGPSTPENKLAMYNTTLVANFAEGVGSAIHRKSTVSPGIDLNTTIIVRNSIIASEDAPVGDDIFIGDLVGSARYPTVTFDNNIVGHSGYTTEQFKTNLLIDMANNIVATSDGNRTTDLDDIVELQLASDSRGLIYIPLAKNSPAIDAGVPFRVFGGGPPFFLTFYEPGCTGIFVGINVPQLYRPDQTGRERPIGAECDIGAIEYEPEPEPEQCYVVPTVNNNTVVFCL